MKRAALITTLALVLVLGGAAVAGAEGGQLTVDGVTYEPSKVSGPTVHYETPDVSPVEAFTERHTWTGNGSENLPCPGGIHWIDNKNVLTISNCLSESTTTTTTSTSTTLPTTTTIPTTTTSTSVPVTTTVTVPPTTTTTVPPATTTSTEAPSTTTIPVTSTLPNTGPEVPAGSLAWLAVALTGLGSLVIRSRWAAD